MIEIEKKLDDASDASSRFMNQEAKCNAAAKGHILAPFPKEITLILVLNAERHKKISAKMASWCRF
jgi:hypothetical protein